MIVVMHWSSNAWAALFKMYSRRRNSRQKRRCERPVTKLEGSLRSRLWVLYHYILRRAVLRLEIEITLNCIIATHIILLQVMEL
ncbi:hypothetical protein PsorP6_012258 [Peronosclerospora sorghi]|uniref:Uncharacterized protein n=1 Tax=Peronosclerospora sorghi TaxID=230839 RepID=A0ACC0WJN4_9STRA|nr:hypothetical protein PsorP6_012258 [Peronosclerospora sorghi]